MRHHQSTLSPGFVCRWAVAALHEALAWSEAPAGARPLLLLQLLVRAAARLRSLWAVAGAAAEAPCWQTVRSSLRARLPATADELVPATTRALHYRLPKSLARRPRTMAVDLHLRPYYGDKGTPGVYRGRRTAGTRTSFAYATLLVLRRGQAFTVGLVPVAHGAEQAALLRRLLEQAAAAGLAVRRLLLDRGFYAATTIAWLQGRSLPFVMPMIRRGKAGRTKAACTGTERFFARGRRGWDRYTWTARPRRGGRKQPAVAVTVAVCMVPRSQYGGPKRRRGGPLVYVCDRQGPSPRQVAAWYRRRFGIETSYRQLGQGLAATCSKNPVYRLLLVAIALVLRNLWVWLHWCCLAERQGGRRRLRPGRLRLAELLNWLTAVLDQALGIRPRALTIQRQTTTEVPIR
jgi:Transposase DDE domain